MSPGPGPAPAFPFPFPTAAARLIFTAVWSDIVPRSNSHLSSTELPRPRYLCLMGKYRPVGRDRFRCCIADTMLLFPPDQGI